MGKQKRNTRSSSKGNNKNNSPNRNQKKKQRRRNNDAEQGREDKETPSPTSSHSSNASSTGNHVASTVTPKNLFKTADRNNTNTDEAKKNGKTNTDDAKKKGTILELSDNDSSASTFTRTHVLRNTATSKNHPIVIDGTTATKAKPKRNTKAKPKRNTKPTLTDLALRDTKLNAELALLENEAELALLNKELAALDAEQAIPENATDHSDHATSDAPSDKEVLDEGATGTEIIIADSISNESPAATADNAMDEDKSSSSSSSSDSTPLELSTITKKRSNLKNTDNPSRKKTTRSVTINAPYAPPPPAPPPTDHTLTPLPDMTTECRYSMIITVPPSISPWPKYVDILRKCLKLLQDQMHTNLWIAGWDPESDLTNLVIKKPKDIPEGKATNRKLFSHFFSGFPNPKKNQSSKIFMKVRFTTDHPENMPIPLHEMGQALSEALADELPVQLGRNPYACQAVKSECLGWFYGSVKSVDSKKLAIQAVKALNLPPNVAIGLQWRSLKDELGKNYPWNANDTPPQALHLDMDHNYAAAFAEPAAKLWKKGAPKRVNGLQLRIIPCLGSSRAIALSDEQKKNCLLMSAKQQFFVNTHTIRVENTHILNLDAKVGDMTLRRYLMNRAPRNEVLQRLFVSVDKSWKGGTHTIITVKPYAAEAMKAINYMIPECLHEYGTDAAAQWFTTPGLLAYQNVKWDPTKRSTTSQQDRETKALVEEDLFGIGTTWKLDAPVLRGQPQRPAAGNLLSTPLQPVQIAIHSRATDDDVRSFGSIFGRTPDDASVATTPDGLNTDANPSGPTNVVVQFDAGLSSLPDTPMTHDDRSFDASSAGFTTGSTRSKLREQEQINDTLRQQMLQLNEQNQQNDDDSTHTEKTTQSTRNQLAVALAALKLLQEQQVPPIPTPPPIRITTPATPSAQATTTAMVVAPSPVQALPTLGAAPAPPSGTAPTDASTLPTIAAGIMLPPNPKAPAPAPPPDIVTGDVGRHI
jgi:hypothetical protein